MTYHDALARRSASNRRALPRSLRTLPPWLSLAGVAVPFVVGFVCASIDLSLLLLPWVWLLIGVAGGALLRSWWALLLVPLALAIGTLPKISVMSSGIPDITGPGFVAGFVLFLLLALVPAAIGAAIGVPLRHELQRLDAISNA
jgi:hypothetical protein